MSYECILLDVKDGVATVTLNRPDRMNAWNETMAAELSDALAECNQSDEVRAVVLTGAGRAFCAGADLGGAGETFAGREERQARARDEAPPMLRPWQLDKPVIAALNGHAVGVGITYSMMCDIRIAAEDAKIQFAFVRRGIVPELASHVIVARVCGFSNAADLLLTGRLITGREAAEIGLVSRALPKDQVLPAAQELAREFHQTAPASVAIAKRLLWDGINSTIPAMTEREAELLTWSGNQADAREGVVSFLEKRPPRWTLRPSRDLPRELLER